MTSLQQEARVLHLEVTTNCNLRCPQCRRTEGDLPNEVLRHGEMTLERAKETFSPEFIRGLRKMFMCGNFGEPAMAKDCLDIYRYFRECNPDIELGMNTNGSLRNASWWKELASILNQPLDFVIWSIDGLQDTNHIYRRDAVWSKVMANAQAFIDAGGHAHWDYLVFEHNKHQVDEAEALARSMGFLWFRLKETERQVHQTVFWLKKVSEYQEPETQGIECEALRDKSIFVNSLGEWYPCCYIATKADIESDHGIRNIPKDQVIDTIINRLDTDPHITCERACGKIGKTTVVKSQWKKNVQF